MTSGETWRSELIAVARGLEALNSANETEFLAIGERFQAHYGQAKEIHAAGGQAAGHMAGGGIEQAVTGLRQMVARITGHLSDSGGRLEQKVEVLHRLLRSVQTLRDPLARFQQIVTNLDFLGTATKIRNSRMALNDTRFLILADQVGREAATIGLKMGEILAKLKFLDHLIRQTAEALQRLQTARKATGRSSVDALNASLERLIGRQQDSARTVQRISLLSEGVSRNIGEIVASMQFHDITRQQVEHVAHALEGLARESGGSGVGRVIRLQSAHLAHARGELVAAVERIRSHLDGIAGSVKDLCGETLNVIGAGERNGPSFAQQLERELGPAADALREYARVNETLSEAMAAVGNACEEMAGFLQDVEQIGESINIIALNATIKANSVGSEGAALEAIALSIQQLAQESHSRTEELHRALSAITGISEGLQHEDHRRGEIESLVEEIRGVLQAVRASHDTALQLLERLDRSGQALAAEIVQSVRAIHVHEVAGAKLDQAIARIEALAALLGQAGAPYDPAAEAELMKRYTMQAERDLHRAQLRKGEGEARPAGTGPSGAGPGELGDNVELF